MTLIAPTRPVEVPPLRPAGTDSVGKAGEALALNPAPATAFVVAAEAAWVLRWCLAHGDFHWISRYLGLLSDPTRLRILKLLERDGERNVAAIYAALKLPQPTVSHHLGLLLRGELVTSRRAGKRIFYAIHPKFLPPPSTTTPPLH